MLHILWGLVLVSVVTSGRVGLAYGSMPALIMSSVPVAETAAANGFNALMRSLGASTGAAVIGVILAQMTTTADGHTFASEAGFRIALLIGGVLALVFAGVAAVVPARGSAVADGDAADPAATPEGVSVRAVRLAADGADGRPALCGRPCRPCGGCGLAGPGPGMGTAPTAGGTAVLMARQVAYGQGGLRAGSASRPTGGFRC